MEQQRLPSWAQRALAKSCADESFGPLVDQLQIGIKKQIAEMSIGRRFSDLKEAEQSALVERNFSELQQSEESAGLITAFAVSMGKAVDDELLAFMMEETKSRQNQPKDAVHPSNVDRLLTTFSKAVVDILESSPPELCTATKLFINRPLPESLRSYVWSNAMKKQGGGQGKSKGGEAAPPAIRLAPSLDVLLSRRCHALLDASFLTLSSRSNASFMKQVVSGFMRMYGFALPANASESFEEADMLMYLSVPLIITFRTAKSNRKASGGGAGGGGGGGGGEGGGDEEDGKVEFIEDDTSNAARGSIMAPLGVEAALFGMLEPRHLGLLKVEGERFSLADRAQGMNRVGSLVSAKDPTLHQRLWRLKRDGAPPGSASGGGGGGGGGMSPRSGTSGPEPSSSSATTVDAFLNDMLKKGLSGLLNLETCLFVWDQGFVVGFGAILPATIVALILGAAEELKALATLTAVIETFSSFCQSVTIPQLQKLMSEHCENELQEVFDAEGGYKLGRTAGDDGILQAMYPRLLLS